MTLEQMKELIATGSPILVGQYLGETNRLLEQRDERGNMTRSRACKIALGFNTAEGFSTQQVAIYYDNPQVDSKGALISPPIAKPGSQVALELTRFVWEKGNVKIGAKAVHPL